MVTYTTHIIWRYVRHEPEQFKLLDVRHNVVKHLILGDCDNLIKYILFRDGSKHKEKNIKDKEGEGTKEVSKVTKEVVSQGINEEEEEKKEEDEETKEKEKDKEKKSIEIEVRCLSIPRNDL